MKKLFGLMLFCVVLGGAVILPNVATAWEYEGEVTFEFPDYGYSYVDLYVDGVYYSMTYDYYYDDYGVYVGYWYAYAWVYAPSSSFYFAPDGYAVYMPDYDGEFLPVADWFDYEMGDAWIDVYYY